MDRAEQAGSAALRSFVAGLRTDLDAVTAGLDLLRKRLLLPA
jgi:hypothetical protein